LNHLFFLYTFEYQEPAAMELASTCRWMLHIITTKNVFVIIIVLHMPGGFNLPLNAGRPGGV